MARLLNVSDAIANADARRLVALLPEGVHVLIAEPRHAQAPLHPLEQAHLDSRRVRPVREREFRTGRALAREALARMGVTDHALLPAQTREPQWPAGIVGSISHCEGVCAIAIAESRLFSGLGIDLEQIGRVDAAVAQTVCTPDELNEASDARQRSLRFSAKESVFKAVFPSTRHFLDFQDVALILDCDRFSVKPIKAGLPMRPLESLRGRFNIGAQLVVTAAWLTAA
jgi:4'-phosphopantetheinyl transferase EntD